MDSSSENMDSSGEGYGTLLFFRKDGAHSQPYPLTKGQITVGSCSDADVRLKINDDCLEKIHCVFDVNENGIATIINKSVRAPIKVNGIAIRKYKVLNDKDTIDIVGKKCQYLNENISVEEVKKNEETLAKKALTPSSNRRRTIAPQVQGRGAAKKSPNLRTKTPVQVQKMSLKRKSEESGVQHISSVTPQKRLDQRSLSEKSKTTSKLVVSKALGAKANTTKRRLSLGSGPRRPNNNVNTRISARNIQFNKNTVTSMITEDEERPSLSMKQISTPVNKKLESVKSSSRRSLKKSNTSNNDLICLDSPRKSILKNTPRKSVISVEDNTSDLLTKTVSFSNVKVTENDEKSFCKRNPGNSSGILYSDETEHLRLSSLSSLSPLGSYPSQDSLFFSSDTESPKKSISRLSLRKSMKNQIEMLPSKKSRLSLAKTSFNTVENPRNSKNASKTRISSRNSINIPKETMPDFTSEDKSTADEINKSDSSDESINLQLSASPSSSEPHSTRDIKDVSVTSINIPTLKQEDSMLSKVSTDELCRVSSRGIESQDSEVSSSNSSPERNIATESCDDAKKDDSVFDKVNEKSQITTRKSSLRRNNTLNDSLEEDISLAEGLPLSPIHPVQRRSSTRKSINPKSTSEMTEYNLQALVRKSNESVEQDEENETLNFSENLSELESSFENSRKKERSLTAEELPPLSSRRSSVRKSHAVETLVSTRRSSLKIPDEFGPDLFSSQDNRVSETTRISLKKSTTSLVDIVDEPGAKGKKSSVLASPFGGGTRQLDLDTPSFSDNAKSVSSSAKHRSLRNSRNSSTSRIQNASILSLNDESQKSSVANRKSSLDNSQEILTPELDTTSSVRTPQPKRNSSIKQRYSSAGDLQEKMTSSLGNTSELGNRFIKNRKSSLGIQQDLTLPLAGITPVPRNRSSVRGRKSLVDDIQDLTSPVDHEMQNLQNDSSRSSRKSSLGNLRQEKMLPLEGKTPLPRNRSSVKSRNSQVDDLQEDLTVPMEYEMHESSLIYDLHEDSTLPIEDEKPDSRTESSRRGRKSSLGALEGDSVILSPVPRNRSSVKSRKSSVNDEVSTLSMEDDTPISKTESSRRSRKSSLGGLQEDSVILSPVPRNRSSVKSRKSSVNDLYEDPTLPMEDDIPNTKIESSRKSRKSSLGNLQGSDFVFEGQSPVPRNRSSMKSRKSLVNDLHEDSTLPMEDDTPNPKIESSRKSRKSSLGNLQQGAVLVFEGQTPVPRNRSSVKSRKSSMNDLHEDSTLPIENNTPNSKIESFRKSRKSSLGNLQQGSVLVFEGQSPVPRKRSSVKSNKSSMNDLHEDSTLPVAVDESSDSENESFKKSRESALGSLHHDSTSFLERQTPVPKSRSSVKSRKSSVNDLLEDSTLPLERQTPIPKNRSSVKLKKSSVSGLHENSTLPLEFQQDLVVTLDNNTPELSRSSVKIKNSSIDHFSEGTSQPLDGGTPQPSRRSSRTPKPSLRYSVRHPNQPLSNQSDASVVCLETSISSVKSKPISVSDNEESLLVQTPEKSAAEKFSVDRLSSIGHPPQNSSSNFNRSSVNAKTPVPYRRSVRRSSKLEESYTISLAHSTLNEGHSSYEEFSIEDSRAETPESSRRSSAKKYKFENSIDSDNLDATQEPLKSRTPGAGIRSSRRTNKSAEDLYSDESHLSMRSQTPEVNHVYSVRSSTTKKDISAADTLDGTPENNTSIVFIDTPLDESRKPGHLRLSKTIHSKIEEVDLTTPKSAIKSRRRKSLPYRPETEDITPVSPLDQNESETGFKTPLTTPGLFEDIRKSVLKSRSRMQKSSSSFMEELNKAKSDKKASKRPRESSGDSGRQHKRRKLVINEDDSFESYDGSFESFQSDEALTDISASNLSQETPSYFSDLTDKPVITHPRTRFSTADEPTKRQSTRRSLPVSAMMVHTSGSNTADEGHSEEPLNELSEELKWVQKSPENNLTNVAGVKRLMKTPRIQNSPKNDLSDVRGTKKLFATPKVMKSPKNELVDMAGIKKLLATPREVKSPKNDLTNIPNLRRIMSPKYQNSPVNDLSDLRGVKKLLGTPKELKDPLNELSDLEGVAEIFNMSGVHRLSTNSDIENNEDMFGQLIVRRPLKTYRGKSLSPNKAIDSYGAKRKTMGDKSVTSPRVEDWIKEQAVIRIERLDDLGAGDGPNESDLEKDVEEPSTQGKKKTRVQEIKDEIGIASPPRRGGRRKAAVEESESSRSTTRNQNKVGTTTPTESPVRKTTRGKSKKVIEEIVVPTESKDMEFTKEVESLTASEGMEENFVESPRRTRGRRNKVESSTPTESPARKATRGKSEKVIEEIVVKNESNETELESLAASEAIEENSVESPRTARGRRKAVVVLEKKPTRGRKNPKETEDIEKPVVAKTTRGKKKNTDEEKSEDIVVAPVESPKITRGRKRVKESPVVEITRGTRNVVEENSKESDTDKNVSETIPKSVRGKKKVIIDEEQSNKVIVASVESPVTLTRGRRKIPVEVPVEEKVTKGRKNTVEEPEDALGKPDAPKIPTRGRRNAKVIEEVIVEKPARGRRKVRGKGKMQEDSSEDALCESSEIVELKKPVSRKNAKDTDKSDENVFSIVEEAGTNEVSKKNTRGTKKVQKLQDVFVESPKPTRGRRKVMEVVESTVDESEESTIKTRKGRNVKTVQAEDSRELLVSSTDIKKSTLESSSKVTKIEEEISSAQVDSTTGDFSPVQNEDSKEGNVSKPIKGRKTKKNVEIEADTELDEKPVLKRTRRGRKVSSDEALNAMETRTETEEVEDKKITKPKSEKVVTKRDSVEDSENSRPTRGVTAKKQTRGKKQVEEEDIEQVKVTRSRRRKDSEDVTEEPAKKITKNNEKSEERVEEASTGNTRKAGRLAKNKAVAKITEEEVSSPKTRSVKGNFNKYGSSFEIESPVRAVGRRKRVHFD